MLTRTRGGICTRGKGGTFTRRRGGCLTGCFTGGRGGCFTGGREGCLTGGRGGRHTGRSSGAVDRGEGGQSEPGLHPAVLSGPPQELLHLARALELGREPGRPELGPQR